MARGPVAPINCARFFEDKLRFNKWLLEPSTEVILESTVQHLHKLDELIRTGGELAQRLRLPIPDMPDDDEPQQLGTTSPD